MVRAGKFHNVVDGSFKVGYTSCCQSNFTDERKDRMKHKTTENQDADFACWCYAEAARRAEAVIEAMAARRAARRAAEPPSRRAARRAAERKEV